MRGAETRTEIAKRIVTEWADAYQVDQAGPGTKARLIVTIEAALKERDERAAKIIDNWDYERLIPGEIAAAIRNEEANVR